MAPTTEKGKGGKKSGKKALTKKKPGIRTIVKKSPKEARRERLLKAKMWEHRTEGNKKKSKGANRTPEELARRLEQRKLKKLRNVTDPSQLVDVEQVEAGVAGIRLLCNKLLAESNELLEVDSDQYVCLQVTLCKVPKNKDKRSPLTIKIPLPHSLVGEDTDVLLITRMLDCERGPEHEKTVNYYKDLLLKTGAAPYVTEVITVKQLRMEYREFEAKKNLANRFQVVLGQDCVMSLLPKLLGKHFYSKHKLPISVDLTAKNLKGLIQHAVSKSILHFNMKGNCSQTKVGRLSQEDKQITENIMAVIKEIALRIPGGWDNVQTLSLKSLKSKSVPIYLKTTTFDEKIKLPDKTHIPTEVGSLSMLPRGKLLHVKKDGNIKLQWKK
ncbi:ribosomal L1 domain-containing protein 1-like [Penaeus japonicus]|uniref:ribosomal L1 domain-containing protein 1-like n=1 Tax=Penaeus japonicus TaxID=27405 RepID=UPI001C714E44|nr:ribosomal L1 domain-containing protein 1-like [Penaeus japonicus]